MDSTIDKKIGELWKIAMASWYYPSVPDAIVVKTAEELHNLGPIGNGLAGELALMDLRTFQTYANLEKLTQKFGGELERGLQAVFKHEQGHRFCPYDIITSMVMLNSAKNGLEEISMGQCKKNDLNDLAGFVINLFVDMTVNTTLARKDDEDTIWLYKHILEDAGKSKWKRVYGRSMEIAWGRKLMPDEVGLEQDEDNAARTLAKLFEDNILDKSKWKHRIKDYARTIGKFIEEEQKKEKPYIDDITNNIPQKLDKELLREIAKRLAKPNDEYGFDEFKDIVAGFGRGDTEYANKAFYEALAKAYDVEFVAKPWARTKISPFLPEKWQPSMGVDKLDIDYSTQIAGRLIPGITTYTWKHRKRDQKNGLEDAVLDVDLYLDSSGSTPNPINILSLPVLIGFVVARKAHKRGAKMRATNFSGEHQFNVQEWTRDLNAIYDNLVIHHSGGTFFPTHQLLKDTKQKHVVIITDTALDNKEKTAAAISELLRRNKHNKVTVYAIIHPTFDIDYLKQTGAEIIQGTTVDVFKKGIGKEKVYSK